METEKIPMTNGSEKSELTPPVKSLDQIGQEQLAGGSDASAPETEKKKRGRPKGSKSKTVEITDPVDPALAKVVVLTFTGYMESRDKKWKPEPAEIASMTDALYGMVEKYAPMIGKYGVEMGFVIAISGYVIPRLDLSALSPEPIKLETVIDVKDEKNPKISREASRGK